MKLLFLSAITAIAFPFSALREGNLKEIVKPYVGEYTCQKATLGETDLANYYKEITLDLKSNGSFSLAVIDKMGKKHLQTGKYDYDDKTGMLRFFDEANSLKRESSLANGEFFITVPVGDKVVRLVFARK